MNNQVHLNDPQLEALIVRAKTTMFFGGRAVGKTSYVGAPFTARNVVSMPRGNHYIASSTYEKVLSDVLPKLQKGWEDLGFKENVHYWVRKWAPKNLDIPKPYFAPTDPHYMIHWFNGAGSPLISADKAKLFVGKEGDSIYGDEMRLWKASLFDQLRKNMRGNVDKFGNLPNHHSELFTTDLPLDRQGDFLFDFDELVDEESVARIIQAEQMIFELKEKLETVRTKKAKKEIEGFISRLNIEADALRKRLVHVIYASSLENVEVLGLETLWHWKKTMSSETFAVSVLTLRRKLYGQLFYSMFNQVDHCYSATDFEALKSLHHNDLHSAPWSTIQTDIRRDQPLHLSGDFNAAIIWLVIGQRLAGRINGVGSLWLTKPKKVRHLAKLFDQHFAAKKRYNNQIIFHFDQTAKPENAINDDTYISEWITRLKELGWSVRENYIGAAPTHEARYALYEKLFDHRDLSTPNLHLNKNTNSDLIKGMEDAPVQHSMSGGKRRFKKDKRSENSKVIPPQHATHGTEALDILVWGMAVESTSFEFINTLTGL